MPPDKIICIRRVTLKIKGVHGTWKGENIEKTERERWGKMKRYRKEKTPVKRRNTESNLNKKHASSTPMDRWMSVQYLRCKVGQCDGTSRVILQESNYTTRFLFQINLKISLSNCFFKVSSGSNVFDLGKIGQR